MCVLPSPQVRRHDRRGQRPVDGGDEPLGSGAHAEGAAQPRGADRGLLARQPGVTGPRHHTESATNVLRQERPQPKRTGTRCRASLHTRLHPGPKAIGAVVNPAGPNLPRPRREPNQIVPRHPTDCAHRRTAEIIWMRLRSRVQPQLLTRDQCPVRFSRRIRCCVRGRVASSDRKLACDSVI